MLREDEALSFAWSPNDFHGNLSAVTAFLHLVIFLSGPIFNRIKNKLFKIVLNLLRELFRGKEVLNSQLHLLAIII